MKKVLDGMKNLRATGFKKQCLALTICLSSGMFTAQLSYASPNTSPLALKSGAPNVYVVKRGDTLWDISAKFLKSPWRWKEIWASNRHVKNPHWIYPGDRLLLCSLNGQPLIGKDEGDGCAGVIQRHQGELILHPRVRVESLGNAISMIPLKQIEQWLDRNVIVAPDALNNAPYILGSADQRVIAAKGQTVYARGAGLQVGEKYGVYRELDPYKITNSKGKTQIIAREFTEVAQGNAVALDGDVSTLELTKSYSAEVRRGDYVLPIYASELPDIFHPVASNEVEAHGKVIRVMGSIGTAAKQGVVTLDRGQIHGAKSGQVLSIYQQGETLKDPKTQELIKLPNQLVGTLMIFKAFDQFSYGYILESSLPIKVGAEIKAPPIVDQQ